MRARQPVLVSLCVSILSLSSACSDAFGPPQETPSGEQTTPVALAVMLAPAHATLATGNQLAITATPMDGSGHPVTADITWSTSDSTVATVSPTGEVRARRVGNAVITAKAWGKNKDKPQKGYATAPVTVVDPPADATIGIAPQEADIEVGGALQFSVTRDSTADSSSVTWSTSNAQVATVSSTGLVTAVSAGVASIRATTGGQTAVAAVTVVASTPVVVPVARVVLDSTSVDMLVGDKVQIVATALDVAGAALSGRTISWSSSNSGVVSVSSTGLLTAVAAGSATVTAQSEGQIASATVTVAAPPVENPPGTGSVRWSNQPSGLSMLTDQPFNSLPSLGWTTYDLYNNKLSVVEDPTVPTGDAKVMQLYYPKGFVGGSGPALAKYRFSEGEVYIGFYWKLSPNWQGHVSGINKLLYVFQQAGTDRQALVLVAKGPVDGPYHLQVANEPDGSRWLSQNVSNVTIRAGQWYKIEMHLKRSSSDGAPNGIVEWWVDGQLAARYTSAKLRDEPFSEVHVDGVWGGAEHVTKTHADYERFGHFHISGR